MVGMGGIAPLYCAFRSCRIRVCVLGRILLVNQEASREDLAQLVVWSLHVVQAEMLERTMTAWPGEERTKN